MQTEKPQIEFPCDYPIKAIGDSQPDFVELVVTTAQVYAPELEMSAVSLNESRNGTFVSVRFSITATGPEQLKSLHEALLATGRVKMVL